MLNFKIRNANKAETNFAYRLSIVCLGKALELELPKTNIQALREKGESILAMGANVREQVKGMARRGSQKKQKRHSRARKANGADAEQEVHAEQ